MATIAAITTLANATSSAHSYTLLTTGGSGTRRSTLIKKTTGAGGTSGGWMIGYGADASTFTAANANALASLNKARYHRYAGSPGAASGSTVVALPDGAATTQVVDTN